MATRPLYWACVALLLGALAAQGLTAIRDKSPTADEFSHHVASGYSYWKTGDFRMNPASPPLPRLLVSFPLLFLDAKAPLEDPSWEAGDSPAFARRFFYVDNRNADELIFWARVPVLCLSLLFALCVFGWALALAGPVAALAALAWYVFCPDILAHSALATADLALAFFFFLALVAFWGFLRTERRASLVQCAVFTGLAFLSKFSALLLGPAFLVLAALAGRLRALMPGRVAAFTGLFLLVVWAGYGFEIKPLLKNTPEPAKKAAVYEQIGGQGLKNFAETVPVPLSTFASGFVSMMHTRAQGTRAFLLGEWSTAGWWYYYFVAFLLKNTLPFLLSVLAGFFMIRRLGFDRQTRAVLLAVPALFFLVTLGDKAQAGIRYFLPVYPLFFVWAGAVTAELAQRGRALKALAAALLLWHAGEALAVSPSYLAYFNEWAGGPSNGYRFLRDSNLDWGQDLKGLAARVKEGGYGRVALHYHWPADPAYYGLDWRPLEEAELSEPRDDVYAISVHVLDAYPWTKEKNPTEQVGHSIFIYDLRSGSGR